MSVPVLSPILSALEGQVGASGLVLIGLAGLVSSVPNTRYFYQPRAANDKPSTFDWLWESDGSMPDGWGDQSVRGIISVLALGHGVYGLFYGTTALEWNGVGLWPFTILILGGLVRMGILQGVLPPL